MRSLRLSALLLLIVAACAKQNNPRPEDIGSGGEGDSGGSTTTSGGKATNGGSTTTNGGSTTTSGGKATSGGMATGGTAAENMGGALDMAGTGGSTSGGAAGKGGSGGTAGKGGSGGTAGKGGSTGSAGTAGKGGSGGTSGTGGGGGSAGSGCKASPSGPIGGISARYQPEITGATGSGIGSKLIIANTGQSTIDLGTLKLRYYLTNEVQATVNTGINWAYYTPVGGGGQVDKKSNVAFTLVPMVCTSASANAYFEFTFAGAGNLEPDHRIYFSWTANNTMSQNFTQTNDYSFDAAATEGTDDMKVTVLMTDGTLVWGTEP